VRARSLASVGLAVAVLGALSSSASAQLGPPGAPCFGLSCSVPGEADVPEARGTVPSVSSPLHLGGLPTPGFYEYGTGSWIRTRAVAYVAPRGSLDQMPASVSNLPFVEEIRTTTSLFQTGTVVVLSHGMIEWNAPAAVQAARNARHRIRARAAADEYGCVDNRWCLYDQDGYGGDMIVMSSLFNGQGWLQLGSWNDRANSVRNRRDNDSLLAHDSYGAGDQYCSDSHSVDSDLSNNLGGVWAGDLNGGDNDATSFAQPMDDVHC
jgi:Peptidase inhibitor family I36